MQENSAEFCAFTVLATVMVDLPLHCGKGIVSWR